MKKINNYFSFQIIFYIELLSLIILINSIPFYILEKAKEDENPSLKSNILSFTIKAGVNEAFTQDKYFQIQSEIYKDYEILKKTNIECSIPKSPDADFGTKININCEIDLLSTPDGNKIKFLDFYVNSDDNLEILDKNYNIIGNYLIFNKKIETKPDYEFVAENITSIKCFENKLIFGIKGEVNKYWIKGFSFNITWNEDNPIKAICECPNIYFTSETNINCTLELLNDDKFINNLNKGIIIKEKIYNAIDLNNEKKLVKISIKDYKEKLLLNRIDCDLNFNGQNKNNNYDMEFNRKSNRGDQYNILNRNKFDKEEEDQRRWEREREEEKRKKKEKEEIEKDEEKKQREQEDLQRYIRQRQREEDEERRRKQREEQIEKEREEQEKRKRNRYYNNDNNDDYNQNQNTFRRRNYGQDNDNNIYNRRRNRNGNNNDDDKIDDNSNVRLLHLQVRYSYGFLYYMGYALTPIPLDHRIKLSFYITRFNQNTRATEQEKENIILKSEEEISINEKNIIVEYIGRYDCQNCKKLILDKNYIKGAQIFNLPEDNYLLDAIEINKNNYLTKSRMQNPPLYITENIYSQNCLINLGGNFFNKNRFFASKFALNLINVGYYNNNNNKNITVYCSINERGIFSCPINQNLNNFEYKLERFIIDSKENIIIDNSILTRQSMINHINCQTGSGNTFRNNINNNNLLKNIDKNNDISDNKKMSKTKKILIWIIVIIVVYYIVSKYCCKKEEEYSDEYNSRWRVSSSNYGGGETYGLRGRGW